MSPYMSDLPSCPAVWKNSSMAEGFRSNVGRLPQKKKKKQKTTWACCFLEGTLCKRFLNGTTQRSKHRHLWGGLLDSVLTPCPSGPDNQTIPDNPTPSMWLDFFIQVLRVLCPKDTDASKRLNERRKGEGNPSLTHSLPFSPLNHILDTEVKGRKRGVEMERWVMRREEAWERKEN